MTGAFKNLTTPRPVSLRARRLGIDSRSDHIIYMRRDCEICRSEGFSAHARIRVTFGGKFIIATVHHIVSKLLDHGEAGFSESSWTALKLETGSQVALAHPEHRHSLSRVRGKIYGQTLTHEDYNAIIGDISLGRYSDIELSAFVTACSARDLNMAERIALTGAMVDAGDTLDWGHTPVVDKHCVGGLPGNRTTPIVVAIVAANGLTMPKTSSRAITSPAGTADTMETLTIVDLDIKAVRHVVEREGACLAWGGAVQLSPADDILIRVERALDIDSDGQLVASVLSKKISAGATHLVLDIPYGPTAKIRSLSAARAIEKSLSEVASAFGVVARALLSDGSQPIGRGIGPALEAYDVLSVLKQQDDSPLDLQDRSVQIAGCLLEMAGRAKKGKGQVLAETTLSSGDAWRKFQAICRAQGGLFEPPVAPLTKAVEAPRDGTVKAIDNRKISQTAKLLGAPDAKSAGIFMNVRLGQPVLAGQPLYTLHAETPGEMDYAENYIQASADTIILEDN